MSCHIAAPVHKCQVADAVSRRRNSVCHAGQNEAALREIPRPPQRARNDNQGNGVRPLSVFVALLALGLAFFAQAGARAYGHMPLQTRATRLHLFPEQTKSGQAQRPGLTAERYEIDVSFQPEKGFLRARAEVTLRVVEAPPPQPNPSLDAIEFELNPHLKILEITDAQGHKLSFDRSGRLGSPKVSVRLAEPIKMAGTQTSGALAKLTFRYEGVLPPQPLDYITKDGILLRDESRWYPAVDLSAFTESQITITVPSNWNAVTSGQPQGSTSAGPAAIYRWRTSRAVSSRAIVAFPAQGPCGPAFRDVSPSPPLPYDVSACFPPEQAKTGDRLAIEIAALLRTYSNLEGPYPHSTLTIVKGFPNQGGAVGYSAPGFLVVSEDVVKFHDYPGYAPEFLPHEIAHQWFPIEVTLAREEDGWLAESLAEYLAWRYLRERDPARARRMVTRAMRDALAPEPLPPLSLGLRLFALEGESVTHATLYQRGMLVFRTLETVIDRERVDRVLREYYQRYAGKAASIADFRRLCEEISGRNLRWFFDYFIEGTRIPQVAIRRTRSAAPNEVSGEIILRNVPPEFNVRVEMRLETAGGPVEHSVATRGEVTPFTATAPQPVTRITLDPDQRILRWTEAAERNRRQRALLAGIGKLEQAGQFSRAAQICTQALALDPENLASNEQQIRFELGRLLYRGERFTAALPEFERVLALGSLDPMASDLQRAWSRVYRARIESRRGHAAAARAEAQAGLAIKSPAVQTRVSWPDAPARESSAAEELRALAGQAAH